MKEKNMEIDNLFYQKMIYLFMHQNDYKKCVQLLQYLNKNKIIVSEGSLIRSLS